MKKLLVLLVIPMSLWARSYSTNFPATEDPISQGGRWLNGAADGVAWNNVQTTPGKVFGNPSEHLPQYADPTALLKGNWGPNQIATGTVVCANPNASYFQEVEFRFRSTLTPNNSRGYEIFSRCLKTSAGYVSIVRWNGALGSWTELLHYDGAAYGVQTGDIFTGSVNGNVLSAYINGVLVASTTDNTYTDGNPGVGFNYGLQSTSVDVGFSQISISDGLTEGPRGPSVLRGAGTFR